jgi:hypothetical protein
VEFFSTVCIFVDINVLFEHLDRLHLDFDRTSVRGVGRLCFAPDSTEVAFFKGIFHNRFNAFEIGFEVIDVVEAVEELSV